MNKLFEKLTEAFEDQFKPADKEELSKRPGVFKLAYNGEGEEVDFDQDITIRISGKIVRQLFVNKFNDKDMNDVKSYVIKYDRREIRDQINQKIAEMVADITSEPDVAEDEQVDMIGSWADIGFANMAVNKKYRDEVRGL